MPTTSFNLVGRTLRSTQYWGVEELKQTEELLSDTARGLLIAFSRRHLSGLIIPEALTDAPDSSDWSLVITRPLGNCFLRGLRWEPKVGDLKYFAISI